MTPEEIAADLLDHQMGLLSLPTPEPAKGKHLARICAERGIRRRWFGLEPDFSLRKRTLAALRGSKT